MHPFMTYTPCAKYLVEQTGDIITFAQFEEGNVINETPEDAESSEKSGDKYDDN